MSMAARVGEEMNVPEKVSYHIRYEKTVSKETEIKFMTDGVLLKELRHDFFLTKYSVIIVDEAHERSVFSDVLIGLLSRIISIRAKRKDPLKLIIMSATIRVEDFMENPRLFKNPPFFIRIGSRQHKVAVHFNLQTPDDYIEAAYRKVCKIHRQLPPGAILVFLTGEKEIQRLVKMLRESFPFKNNEVKKQNPESKERTEPEKASETPEPEQKKQTKAKDKNDAFCALPEINLDSYAIEPLDTENLEHHQSDDEDESHSSNFVPQCFEAASPLYTLPLYSVLPFRDQEKIFKPPPEGSRLCVVATNVAETSITIPKLKYVVDTGKVKTKTYNSTNGGISKFEIVWCSKASANQRAGRCGRTEGGHCYRLYSSAVFEHDFPNFSLPEIQRIPVDDILLQMKALGIDRVVEFPFPSPPEKEALMAAEKRLVWLGALQDLKEAASLQELKKWEYSAKVTPVGKAMSKFPVSPRYAKMLLLAFKHNCIQHVVAIVCALTVPQLFVPSTASAGEEEDNDEANQTLEGMKKIGAGTGNSLRLGDVMVLLRTVAVFGESKHGAKFCRKYGIRYKAMLEIQKMYTQIVKEMNQVFPESQTPMSMTMYPPSDEKVEDIRKIMTACLVDHVARKMSREETKDEKGLKNAYKCLDCEDPVFIHPSSSQFERLPEFVVYNEIIETSKRYMKGVVEIEPEWLPAFAPSLCSFSKPLDDPPPTYDQEKDKIYCSMKGTFGRWQWEIEPVRREMPADIEKYKWFCFFFLDGQVCPAMKNYLPYLFPHHNMVKSWFKTAVLRNPKMLYLLQAIDSKKVDSRKSLIRIWEQDPKYLLREVCVWLPEEKHLEIEMAWPPLL